jgi:hypothetical protein
LSFLVTGASCLVFSISFHQVHRRRNFDASIVFVIISILFWVVSVLGHALKDLELFFIRMVTVTTGARSRALFEIDVGGRRRRRGLDGRVLVTVNVVFGHGGTN